MLLWTGKRMKNKCRKKLSHNHQTNLGYLWLSRKIQWEIPCFEICALNQTRWRNSVWPNIRIRIRIKANGFRFPFTDDYLLELYWAVHCAILCCIVLCCGHNKMPMPMQCNDGHKWKINNKAKLYFHVD